MGTPDLTSECIMCGACEPVCPADAIKWEETA